MTEGLFILPAADCDDCGRDLVNEICPWCSARSTGYEAQKAVSAAVVKDAEWHIRANDFRRERGSGSSFTADDLRAAVGLPVGSSNQVGALLHSWNTRGLIEAAGFATSTVKANHGRILRLWSIR